MKLSHIGIGLALAVATAQPAAAQGLEPDPSADVTAALFACIDTIMAPADRRAIAESILDQQQPASTLDAIPVRIRQSCNGNRTTDQALLFAVAYRLLTEASDIFMGRAGITGEQRVRIDAALKPLVAGIQLVQGDRPLEFPITDAAIARVRAVFDDFRELKGVSNRHARGYLERLAADRHLLPIIRNMLEAEN